MLRLDLTRPNVIWAKNVSFSFLKPKGLSSVSIGDARGLTASLPFLSPSQITRGLFLNGKLPIASVSKENIVNSLATILKVFPIVQFF